MINARAPCAVSALSSKVWGSADPLRRLSRAPEKMEISGFF